MLLKADVGDLVVVDGMNQSNWQPCTEDDARNELDGYWKDIDLAIQSIKDSGDKCVIRTPFALFKWKGE